MQVLHIDSSITGAASVSRQLTAQTVAALVAANPGAKVEYLDLAVNAPDHLNAVSMGFRTGQAATTEAERAQNAISEALVSQFLAADGPFALAPYLQREQRMMGDEDPHRFLRRARERFANELDLLVAHPAFLEGERARRIDAQHRDSGKIDERAQGVVDEATVAGQRR